MGCSYRHHRGGRSDRKGLRTRARIRESLEIEGFGREGGLIGGDWLKGCGL